ncbi:hypothetical protein BC832DRAFT_378469 [Gaertneriomyces semiglobifer]|nr:hypothetical protein BC832DRAFT_378469 [Gaertneriomyces semiglobifer]
MGRYVFIRVCLCVQIQLVTLLFQTAAAGGSGVACKGPTDPNASPTTSSDEGRATATDDLPLMNFVSQGLLIPLFVVRTRLATNGLDRQNQIYVLD